MTLSARVRAQSLQQKKPSVGPPPPPLTPSIVVASNDLLITSGSSLPAHDGYRRRTSSGILRHVRSTINPSSSSHSQGDRLTANTVQMVSQSCYSSPPLSRTSSRRVGAGSNTANKRPSFSARVRTISASATPLSAIRARGSIFAPKRWSNFLRTSNDSNEDIQLVGATPHHTPPSVKTHTNEARLPSISLPFNVQAAEGSALMNAMMNRSTTMPTQEHAAWKGDENVSKIRHQRTTSKNATKSDEMVLQHSLPYPRYGLDNAEIRSWLQDTVTTSLTHRANAASTVATDQIGENTEQSIYVIASENSIYSDDFSFSTCPTPMMDSLTHTPSTSTTPNLAGTSSTKYDTSSPSSSPFTRRSHPPSASTYDISAWGSHPDGLCITTDELSSKIKGILWERERFAERERQMNMEKGEIEDPSARTSKGHDDARTGLRGKISVADFLQVAKGPRSQEKLESAIALQAINRLSIVSSNHPATSLYSESVCGHEDEVVIRTAWRTNLSKAASSHSHDEKQGTVRRERKRLTLSPLLKTTNNTAAAVSHHELGTWEECKTPKAHLTQRNSSCPPSPTTVTTTAIEGEVCSKVLTTPVRSMTVPASCSTSTWHLDDERDSFDLCEHLLQRARQHRRYAIHE